MLAGFVGGFFESGLTSTLPLYGLALGLGATAAALLVSASGLGSALMMLKLQLAAKMSPELLLGLTICAVGVEAAIRGIREKKPAVAAAVVIPLLLGAAGGLSGVGWISDAAVWVTAFGLPLAGPVLGSRSL